MLLVDIVHLTLVDDDSEDTNYVIYSFDSTDECKYSTYFVDFAESSPVVADDSTAVDDFVNSIAIMDATDSTFVVLGYSLMPFVDLVHSTLVDEDLDTFVDLEDTDDILNSVDVTYDCKDLIYLVT